MITVDVNANICNTSLKGSIDCSYAKLVSLFGEPNSEGDGYKVDAEWILNTSAGPAAIYNYKNGKNYNGASGDNVEDITDWHIGAHNKETAQLVIDYINSN